MTYNADEENGIIEYTQLGIEDHGMFYFTVGIAFDGSGQGYQVVMGGSNAYIAIRSVLEALEVDRWEDLKGVACRVRRKDYLIRTIGHIYKDQWSKRTEEE